MRKKSHISLAMYLARGLRYEELLSHRKAFYLGSILPDLTPKMVTDPHEFETSWTDIRELVCQIVREGQGGSGNSRMLWRQTGVVMHYLADYFTFPHNTTFGGNLKDHCLYESDLKYLLRAYLQTPEAAEVFEAQRPRAATLQNPEQLFADIEQTHQAYMRTAHTAMDDCIWITEICSRAALALAALAFGAESEDLQLYGQIA